MRTHQRRCRSGDEFAARDHLPHFGTTTVCPSLVVTSTRRVENLPSSVPTSTGRAIGTCLPRTSTLTAMAPRSPGAKSIFFAFADVQQAHPLFTVVIRTGDFPLLVKTNSALKTGLPGSKVNFWDGFSHFSSAWAATARSARM